MAKRAKGAGHRPVRNRRQAMDAHAQRQAELDEAEAADSERMLKGLERIARVASVLGPVLAAVLGPRPHPPVPPVPELDPDAVTYAPCRHCAPCPECGMLRRAHVPGDMHDGGRVQ